MLEPDIKRGWCEMAQTVKGWLRRVCGALRTYRYELIALMNGATIMVLEIVGARIVAPQFGSSVYVWTAVIGVILGSLAAGYWYGGRLADRGATNRGLARLLALAAAVLWLSLLGKDLSLAIAGTLSVDVRGQALVAALLIFAPVNLVMGMVSPYLVKLKVVSVETVGASAGRLEAAGTLGSILGTFATGYWLIAWMGNRALGLCLVVALLAASLVAERRWLWPVRVAAAMVVTGMLWLPNLGVQRMGAAQVRYDGDSAYSRWQVLDVSWSGRPARLLATDASAAQSGVYLDKPEEPLFDYATGLMKVVEAAQAPERVLIVGGGTYTLPMILTERYPGMRVDVVEIDPQLDEIASKYFGYKANDRIRIVHEDGRTFLNNNRQRYDVILMDAFNSTVPPFQLTTREAVRQLERQLAPGGVMAVNLIAAREGARAAFGQAEAATYAERFGQVALGPVNALLPAHEVQNLVLVAGNDRSRTEAAASAVGATLLHRPEGLVLTDDYAPVEQMVTAE